MRSRIVFLGFAALLSACGGGDGDGDGGTKPGPVVPGTLGEMRLVGNAHTLPAVQYQRFDINVEVVDKQGAIVRGVTVRVEGDHISRGSLALSQVSTDIAAFSFSNNAAGSSSVKVVSDGYGTLTLNMSVRATEERFDGWYFCVFDFPYVSAVNGPLVYRPDISVVKSQSRNKLSGNVEFVLNPSTGNFTGEYRQSLDYRVKAEGVFSIDAQGNATMSGIGEQIAFGTATGEMGTLRCARGIGPI